MTSTISLVTGTMFLVWLGEQITERGIGNGISMLIFAGIVAGLPQAVGGTLELARTGELHVMLVLFLLALTILVTGSWYLSNAASAGSRSITPSASRAARCTPPRPPICR